MNMGILTELDRARDDRWQSLALVGRGFENHREVRNLFKKKGWDSSSVLIGCGPLNAFTAAALGRIISLRYLAIDSAAVGSQGVEYLRRLYQLTHLELRRCRIGPDGTQYLARLTELTSLDLGWCEIGPEGAKHLAGLTKLTNLNLHDCKIGFEGAKYLAELTELRSLDLTGCKIGSEGAQYLANLQKLTSLNLSGCEIGPDGAKHLAGLTKLTKLNLHYCKIGSEGAKHLAELTELTSLDLWGCEIEPEGIYYLAGLRKLTKLDLSWSKIGATGVMHLSKLDLLTHLALWNCDIGPDGTEHLARLGQLTDLILDDCEIGPHGAKYLAGLSKLESLNLSGCKIGSEGAKHLSGLCNLQSLGVTGNELTELPEFLLEFPYLRELHLSGNPLGIPDSVLECVTDPKGLFEAYRQARNADAKPLLEVKCVLLGEPRAGKSWLRYRLTDTTPPESREETYCYACDRVELECRVPSGTWAARALRPSVNVGVTLFDFGGQQVLHATHRYFMASLRNVYVVCISAEEEDFDNTKLDYWLRLINYEHMWQRARRATELKDLQSDFRRVGIVIEQLEARLASNDAHNEESTRVRNARSGPPVVVVVTYTEHHKPRWLNRLDPNKLSEITNGPIRVVNEYDNGEKPESEPINLEQVREAVKASISDLGEELWSTRMLPEFFKVKESLEQWSTVQRSDEQGANAAASTHGSWMTQDQGYRNLFRNEWFDSKSDKDRSLSERTPRIWLLVYRDLGLVHWVGDWRSVLTGEHAGLASVIFNPNWVRGPVYNLTRRNEIATNQGIVTENEFRRILRAKPTGQEGGFDTIPHFKLSDGDLNMLREYLLVIGVCARVLPVRTPGRAAHHTDPTPCLLIPDHLREGKLERRGWKEATLTSRARYEFLPAYALLRFIAACHAHREPDALVCRDSIVLWGGLRFDEADEAEALVSLNATAGVIDISIRNGTSHQRRELRGAIKSQLVMVDLTPLGWEDSEDSASGAGPQKGDRSSAGGTTANPAVDHSRRRAVSSKSKRPSPLRGLSVTLYKLVKSNSDAGVVEIGSWTDVAKHGMDLARAKEEWREQIRTLFDKKRKDKDGKAVEAHVWLEKCGDAIRTACQSSDLPRPLEFWLVQKDVRHLRRHDDGAAGSRKPLEDD